jgi:predicted dehydrogenase
MKQPVRISRRDFLKGTLATGGMIAAPTIIPASALGADGTIAPSNRIVMGVIGVGLQGTGNMRQFAGHKNVQIVAVCDVDKSHRDDAKNTIDQKHGNTDCVAVDDFREITRRDDIDAVCVATPDHWHVIPAIDAARHGKDMYVQKPLTLTIGEGRALVEAVRRHGRVLQTGSQQRSDWGFRRACELARNGRIGKIHTVKVGISKVNRTCGETWEAEPIPEGFDYNFWLGQAPWQPYTEQRCHYTFRFLLDYSGGQVTNWGAHHLDIAQWGLGMDDSGPVEIEGKGVFPTTGLFTTATNVHFECVYENGTRLICGMDMRKGTTFEGSEGTIYVNRGVLEVEPESLKDERIGPGEIRLYDSRDHMGDFLNCVETRRRPICDVEIGHRSASLCHLGNIAMLLDRKLKWDPKAERFDGDEEANRMISRAMRSPWRL